MAKFTFNMPDVGEGVAEAEIVEWMVKVGDVVSEDQHLVDVMTDKATIDIESPVDGTVIEVAGEVGDVVAVGSMLLVVEVEGEDAPESEAAPVAAPASAPTPTPIPTPAPEPTPEPAPTLATKPAPEPENVEATSAAKVLASPAVRQRARELGIDLGEVKPANDGRVRHADLDQFLAYNAGGGFSAASVKREDEVIKVIGLRKRIAQNMSAAKRNIPHFTYVEECDVTALEAARGDLNASRGAKPKLTMLPLLITAFCKVLPHDQRPL